MRLWRPTETLGVRAAGFCRRAAPNRPTGFALHRQALQPLDALHHRAIDRDGGVAGFVFRCPPIAPAVIANIGSLTTHFCSSVVRHCWSRNRPSALQNKSSKTRCGEVLEELTEQAGYLYDCLALLCGQPLARLLVRNGSPTYDYRRVHSSISDSKSLFRTRVSLFSVLEVNDNESLGSRCPP